MIKTYVSTVPLISNGVGGNKSTFHQDHVESFHYNAFMQQRSYINDMITNKISLPTFAKKSCGESTLPLEIHEMVLTRKNDICTYNERKTVKDKMKMPTVYWIDHRGGHPLNKTQIDNIKEQFGYSGSSGTVELSRIQTHLNQMSLLHQQIPRYMSTDLQLPSLWQQSKQCSYTGLMSSTGNRDREDKLLVVKGLCGRDEESNTLDSLAHSSSHLIAIYEAIMHNPNPNHPYALIIEDDVILPFDVDWNALIQSAPSDNAILPLSIHSAPIARVQWWRWLRNSTQWFK